MLLKHGVTVKTSNLNEWNALHITAGYNKEEIASVLLEHGADVNKVGIDGRSALHVAAANDSKVIIALVKVIRVNWLRN